MNVRPVNASDLKTLQNWYVLHDQSPESVYLLSDIGFIVDDYAAAFLYTTNSNVCWIESYISNPNTDKNERKKALDMITDEILKKAKELNYKVIICFIENKSTYNRCLDYGFTPGESKIIFSKRI